MEMNKAKEEITNKGEMILHVGGEGIELVVDGEMVVGGRGASSGITEQYQAPGSAIRGKVAFAAAAGVFLVWVAVVWVVV